MLFLTWYLLAKSSFGIHQSKYWSPNGQYQSPLLLQLTPHLPNRSANGTEGTRGVPSFKVREGRCAPLAARRWATFAWRWGTRAGSWSSTDTLFPDRGSTEEQARQLWFQPGMMQHLLPSTESLRFPPRCARAEFSLRSPSFPQAAYSLLHPWKSVVAWTLRWAHLVRPRFA